jgi:hypothetical protein
VIRAQDAWGQVSAAYQPDIPVLQDIAVSQPRQLHGRIMTGTFDRTAPKEVLIADPGIGPREPEMGPAMARLARMAYDTELADRIRFLIGTGPGMSEKKMFGGLAFLIGGNMAISASGKGGALVRVDPADSHALIATAGATLAVMGGRTMQGWLRVSPEDLETDEQLTEWVNRAVTYTRSLPPKR